MRYISAFIFITLLSSCSFNKIFLQPEQIPPQLTEVRIMGKNNETRIMHIGKDKITFTDANNKPIDPGYTIDNVYFKSKSENSINGWYIQPTKTNLNTAILFLHGNAGNLLEQFQGPLALAKLGFTVFIIDYSGYGLSNGKASANNLRQDGNSAFQWLSDHYNVQFRKLIIYGQSLGGHLAATIAKDNEPNVDALVMEGAFSSYKDIAAHSSNMGFLARTLVKNKYSAYRALRNFHKPVLIIHSTEDQTVPFSMGQKLYANANEPKQFYVIQHAHIEAPVYYADSIKGRILSMVPQP